MSDEEKTGRGAYVAQRLLLLLLFPAHAPLHHRLHPFTTSSPLFPSAVAALVPTSALYLIEEAWNSYPHCKTVLVNGYMATETFKIDVETLHVDGSVDTENALGLSAEELKQRKVEYIDIRTGYSDPKAKDYRADYNASLFKSSKTGRGPLEEGWYRSGRHTPIMCAYKLVRAQFNKWGLQGSVEGTIINSQRDLFGKTLSACFCTIDNWHSKTMEDVRHMEEEVAKKADSTLKAKKAAGGAAAAEPVTVPNAGYHESRRPAGCPEIALLEAQKAGLMKTAMETASAAAAQGTGAGAGAAGGAGSALLALGA